MARCSTLRTVGQLAREAGVSRWTMRRRLHTLARSLPPDATPFLLRLGGRTYVEVGHLRRAYPALVAPHLATRDDVDALRREVSDLRTRVRAQGARIRALESRSG